MGHAWLSECLSAAVMRVWTSGSGAPQEERALLQGVAICGHCGRMMQVRYASGIQYRCEHGLGGELPSGREFSPQQIEPDVLLSLAHWHGSH